jgi:FixJ family two-component response regulator
MLERPPIVYIVDDDEMTRRYYSVVLTDVHLDSSMLDSAESFLDMYDPHQAGCLLLDVEMPGMSGLALQQRLNLIGAIIPVIFVSGHADLPMAVDAMQHGAFDFIQKPVGNETLLAHVRKALEHDSENRQMLRRRDEMLQRFEALTSRERDVLMLLMAGRSNKAMASDLRLSQRTVELHRARVMEKTGSRSLAQLIRMAMDLNFAHSPRH